MAYIRIGEDESTFGSFGCGPGCGCAGCRQMAGSVRGLGERYVPEEEDAPPPRTPPQPAAPPPPHLTGWGRFGELPLNGHYPIGEPPSPTQRPVPIFRFDCSTGCPFPPFVCQGILRQAILQACRLALNAARKLEANPRDPAAVNSFRSIFGHDPAQPLPWPGIKDSGVRFAGRFRMVEQALLKAGTLYRCDPCTAQSRYEIPAATIILDVHAMAIPPNEVRLCPSFWQLSGLLQAGVVLHEMFHLRFDPCFSHGATETKRTNAYCYEAFALSFTSQKPEPLTIQKCNASPP